MIHLRGNPDFNQKTMDKVKMNQRHNENKNDIMTHANILYLDGRISKDDCLTLWKMGAGLEEDQVTGAEFIKNVYSQNQLGKAIFINL